MIGIIDLGMGNLRSVWNAIYQAGFDPGFVSRPEEIESCSRLILPGVGSFQAAVDKMDEMGLREPILQHSGKGRPLLGICLGMQLLAEKGTEGAKHSPGLGLLRGHVTRLEGGKDFPVPHMGWNNVRIVKDHPVTRGVKDGVDFYFVHSFGLCSYDAEQAIGVTDYGQNFASIAGTDNVIGFQFHPEKSQVNGLKLIENFCDWNP